MTQAKVIPGQAATIKADFVNRLIDIAGSYDAKELAALFAGVTAPGGAATTATYVLNATGVRQPQCAVYGLDGLVQPESAYDSHLNGPIIFNGLPPNRNVHIGNFGVGQRSAEAGEVVPVRLDLSQVLIDDDNQANHPASFCEIVNGETRFLRMGSYGSAEILYRELGSGPQWGLVRLGRAQQVFPVKLANSYANVFGAAGYTYGQVTDLGSRVLATNVDPVVPPSTYKRFYDGNVQSLYTHSPADFGLARYVQGGFYAGLLSLIWVNEA